ncbi:hypothetical protein TcYC6_0102130 [Trypanosoma cruzi]|uniref:Uncharacterized protein n=1 Tax=Trypanosoma cruzi TaxID=5693 RepID=A0A7J6Y7F1_TRYCR|nr:hypothetical protein ECC02_004214 [Trypanosoma cruzi]KAF8294452.1 hypothetical protein TcYC6_0102130 [Trypanosoma cruzi]
MFKHRDNMAHAPFSIDPQGSGTTMKAVSFGQEQRQQHGDRVNVPTAAAKKRPRDIRGIERFRQVIYGEKGLPRLHAMVARNPILMYPPEGIEAARKRMQKKCEEASAVSREGRPERKRNLNDSHPPEGDEDVWTMFEERQAAETSAAPDGPPPQQSSGNETNAPSFFAAAPSGASVGGTTNDQELANYHRRQLDALLGIYYEFNHLTFMKLPMKDTLQLLQRCGRGAVAQVMEFEMQLRMQRETRLKELDAVAEEERELKRRQMEVHEKRLEIQMQVAEKIQQDLADEMDDDKEVGENERG